MRLLRSTEVIMAEFNRHSASEDKRADGLRRPKTEVNRAYRFIVSTGASTEVQLIYRVFIYQRQNHLI